MLVYGSRTKPIWAGAIPTPTPCDACGQAALHPVVLQWYFHIFWIPFLAYTKDVIFDCAHCQKRLGPHDLPDTLVPVAKQARSEARTPLYLFVGLAAALGASLAYQLLG